MRIQISDFLFLLLAMSLNGSLLFLFSIIVEKLTNHYVTVRWTYNFMKAIILFLLIPVAAALILIFYKQKTPQIIMMAGEDFVRGRVYQTNTFSNLYSMEYGNSAIFIVFFTIWISVFGGSYAFNLVRDLTTLKKIHKLGFLCENDRINEIKRKAAKQLDIKKDIPIYISDILNSPFITGIFNTKIFLPEKYINDPMIELILEHELMHYKSHDLIFKRAAMLIQGIHWFNPLIFLCVKKFYHMSEFACDESILEGREQKVRTEYAHAVINMLRTEVVSLRVSGLASTDIKIVKRRIYFIMKKRTENKKIIAALISIVTAAVCPLTVYASAAGTVTLEDRLATQVFEANNVVEEGKILGSFTEIYNEEEKNEDVRYLNQGIVRGFNPVNVTITGTSKNVIDTITLSKGSKVQLNISSTNDADSFRAGLMNSNGSSRSVNSSQGAIVYTFTITETDEYDIYVQGNSSNEIHIVGSVYIE